MFLLFLWGFTGGASGKEVACQFRRCKRHGYNPWVRKVPWRRAWQPTPVVLPRESHGLRSLLGYSPRGLKESHMAKRLILFFLFSYKSGPKFAQAFLVCNHFALFQQLTLSQGSQISTCRERPQRYTSAQRTWASHMSLSLPTLQTFCIQALAKCFPNEGAPVYCTENAIHVFPTHLHLAHQIVLLGLFDI